MTIFDEICNMPWKFAVEPFKIAGNVFYVGNMYVANYIIDSGDGLILIDASVPHTVYLMFESIRKLGFNPKDIKLLLVSHAHYDHCGGVRPVSEYTGAKVYMGKEDIPFLNEKSDLVLAEKYEFIPYKVDETYNNNSPIKLGNTTIHTVHTPGHTPGTNSFFFTVAEKGKTYNCALHGGIGLNTLTDKFLKEWQLPTALRDDFLNSLLKVRDKDVDIVLGSHPDQINMLEKVHTISDTFNPFIDRNVWKNLIDIKIKEIRELMRK